MVQQQQNSTSESTLNNSQNTRKVHGYNWKHAKSHSYRADKKCHAPNNSQKLFMAKNYLEQELEAQGQKGHVRYDNTNKALVQFRIKEGTVAVLQQGKLSVFKMPVKKFQKSLPLEFQTIEMNSIRTENATCCKRCKSWKQQHADITRCRCGGYLVSRKRFSTSTVESWDAEFLEVRFAEKDIREASRIERNKPRKARYVPTGITHRLAGTSSADLPAKPQKELLLVPKGDNDDLQEILVSSTRTCSLVFVADITSDAKAITDADKAEILAECNKDDSEDRQFASESKRFITSQVVPEEAKILVDSWNESHVVLRKKRRNENNGTN